MAYCNRDTIHRGVGFMPVPSSQQGILFQRSGNQCAFPDCNRVLTAASSPVDEVVVLGEVAHIVAESPDGPRGASPLTREDRNRYANLVLLCNNHHQIVDSQPETYTIEWLKARKEEHEARVEGALGSYGASIRAPAPRLVRETIHSNLLPIERMPPQSTAYPATCRTSAMSLTNCMECEAGRWRSSSCVAACFGRSRT